MAFKLTSGGAQLGHQAPLDSMEQVISLSGL